MRVLRLALFTVMLTALPALARSVPTIGSINPGSIHVQSGEWFMTITGTHFLPLTGVSVIFSGPGGTVSLPPNAGTDTTMYVWIPEAAVNHAGYYTVTVRVPDGFGGTYDSNQATFHVIGTTVHLYVPVIVLQEASSLQGAYADFDVSATSEYGQNTYLDCSYKSGSLFPIGTTEVDCSATDDFGGGDKAYFNVQVADTTAPTIFPPKDMTVFGTKEGADVKYDVAVRDTVDPEATLNCSPANGTLFPLGTTTVTCTSLDRFKNQGTASFRVHVGSDDLPALTVPVSFTAEAQSVEGSYVNFDVSAVDVKGNIVPVECSAKSGQLFPLGSTDVKCVATGASGLSETEIFTVTVADSTPPVISVPRAVQVQATALEGEKVVYSASAKDAVSGDLGVSCYPASGSLFAPGDTTVNCTATDKFRNQSTASFVVSVSPWVDPTDYAKYGNPDDGEK